MKRNTRPVVTNYTINLKDDAFLLGGISANVTSIANVAISGYRNEYNVSLLKSVEMNSSFSDIDLCTRIICNEEEHWFFITLNMNSAIVATECEESSYIHTIIIVLCVTVGVVCSIVVVAFCVYKMHKNVSIESIVTLCNSCYSYSIIIPIQN